MVVVANMIELGQIDTGMVVSCEGSRDGYLSTFERLLSEPPNMRAFRANLATFTLGSGSVAMILRHKVKSKTGKQLLGGYFYSQTQHNDLCVAQTTWMRTNSTPLLHEGLKVIYSAWDGFSKELGWNSETVDKVFTHQVSEKQRELGLKAIGLNRGIDYPTLIELGNIASVSAPLSMALAYDKDFLQDGDKVCLIGVGSGINSLVLGIEW
jgi:3-oxoacyl-[acyl-carrier-protein] synthase-3